LEDRENKGGKVMRDVRSVVVEKGGGV